MGSILRTVTLSAIPTVTASSAYTAKDAQGGLITFTNAVKKGRGSGTIEAIIIIDDAKQADITEIHFFNQTFTASVDHAIFSPSDEDLENYIGYGEVIVADFIDLDDNSVAVIRDLNLPFNLVSGGTSLFAQMVTRGTPTYAAVDDITVKVVIRQD